MNEEKFFNEKSVVENNIIKKLQEKGWEYIPSDELNRDNYEEPLLTSNLVRKLEKFNKNIGESEIRQVLNELKLKSSGQEDSKKIIEYFKFGIPVKFEKERVVNYVQLFDFKNVENNEFIVSNQIIYQNGDNHIRTDIVLYVNGIPLVIIECKNPVDFSSNWEEAYAQIKKYENKIPEISKYLQIGIAAESIAKYFPVVPWQDDVDIYEWKQDDKDSIDSTIEMLSPEIILDIIKNFLFYRIRFGKSTKVLTRYMQYRAANKIVDRVVNNLESREGKDKGLIWHWQGSGKTLTMIFAGYKLFYSKRLENPTIFYIVDRKDLEEQLTQEFNALKIHPDIISDINNLREIITHDSYKGKRGIILTLVHKFRTYELEDLSKELKKLSETEETISNRKNIISFIDEGHRTQYGTLSSQMRSILTNSFFFAFTGTPISKKERDTYYTFGYPDEPYFDKYFIAQSIRDGFTVKIAYKPRLEKEVHLKKENLDAFIESELEEIPEEYREKVESKIGKRLNASRIILENPEMIRKVAIDIKKHFIENVEGKFKAMVVAESRKACVSFKRELDKLLPEKYSEIVMTYNQNEKHKEISEYHDELRKRYHGLDDESIKKSIVEDFKEEDNLKILIVTDMLLTGFDAPRLQTMYLFKLLKEHRLLQAIARTNRPYKDIKEAGVIIDYVGILGYFKEAFRMYSEGDMQGVLLEIEDLREDFVNQINSLLKIFKEIPKDKYDKETLLKAIEILTSEKAIGKGFIEGYRSLRRLFELLGPDEIKTEYFSKFKWLSAIYTYYSKQVLKGEDREKLYFRKYFNKTLEYIYKTTEIKDVEKQFPEIEFDEHYLKNLTDKVKNKKEQAANIVFALNKYILVEKKDDPIYIALAEKVERILERWKEKKKDYEKILEEGIKVFEERNKLKSRQEKLGFSNLEYATLLTLENKVGRKKRLIEDVKELSEIIKEEIYSGWVVQPTAIKKIERELRSFLRKRMKTYDLTYEEMDSTFNLVKDTIKKYGKDI